MGVKNTCRIFAGEPEGQQPLVNVVIGWRIKRKNGSYISKMGGNELDSCASG